MRNARGHTPLILHVEDDDGMAYLVLHALREHHSNIELIRLCNGEQAMDFLSRTGAFQSARSPSLVVLDLHLPHMSGLDVLRNIRGSERFDGIPVVVFTSSVLPEHRDQALAFGADQFMQKPSTIEGYDDILNQFARLATHDRTWSSLCPDLLLRHPPDLR